MSVTIKKIANDLKLAVSTVSKALHDSHEISEETKRIVFDYAKKLEYIPNPYAGSLKSRTTHNIAVVIPEVADSFFSNAINGIDSIAQTKGFHVMVYLTHENSQREESILQELRSGRVDGILISVSVGVKKDSSIHKQLAKELPLIFFDRACDEVETVKVLTDDFQAAYNATCLLLSKNCKAVTFLSVSDNLSIIEQRKQGFLKALTDNKIKITPHHIIACSESEGENIKLMRKMLKSKRRADAVICSVEKLAMQFYCACNDVEITIPDQVKVIAFSNLSIANLLSPSLSVVAQPAFEMGKVAATLLFKSLAKKTTLKNEVIILPSVLQERESSLSRNRKNRTR